MGIIIALGSNYEPEDNLRRAVERLVIQVRVLAASRVYETAALDEDGQPIPRQGPYLNAALLVDTDLTPTRLKYDVLRPIEAALGRVRFGTMPTAMVTIDLDLALYGDQIIEQNDPPLVLPDPNILTRAYVALPLADLVPEVLHPVTGEALATIAARFATTPGLTIRDDIHLFSGGTDA
ncbi:MAG: 2-amino-4-hydroxy-6-hydroxymethyldihydropteridine diphosphokinase [Chloroflexi bacterium]|nr:2-amino-4-hydroxy-6-hydroxymethyldihydropteridine diphosphokinase [Chloroflexota bacterium]